MMTRREFVACASAALVTGTRAAPAEGEKTMYGLIGKINSVPGKRDELMALLLEGTRDMPGCLSYVVAADAAEDDALWVTEVWESRESHAASLTLDSVQQAIAKGRPLMAGFGARHETVPLGGHGLAT